MYVYVYVVVVAAAAAVVVVVVVAVVSFWSGWNALHGILSGGRRPLIAGCLSLHRLGMDLPVTRTVWDSSLRPPASERRSSTN